jgi:hypothetical protein
MASSLTLVAVAGAHGLGTLLTAGSFAEVYEQ